MKILITGSTGFIGVNLIRYLYDNTEISIVALARSLEKVAEHSAFRSLNYSTGEAKKSNSRLTFFKGDLTDINSLNTAMKGIDVIINLASKIGDWGSFESFASVNIQGTRNLIESAKQNSIKKIIHMSSLTVHKMEGHLHANEQSPRNVSGFPYGETKKIEEELFESWSSNHEGNLVIIRPAFIIFGPFDQKSFVNVIHAIKEGKFALVHGGKRLISYVYVENLCHAVTLFLKSSASGIYNVVDNNISWRNLTKKYAQVLNVKEPKISVPYSLLFIVTFVLVSIFKLFNIKVPPPLTFYRIRIPHKHLAFSNKKIIMDLSYSPPVSLMQAIKRTCG
jgi:nucleoside-diphosphate-sugar epimerase